MPTLFRLLLVIGILAAFGYGLMLAMVTFLHPEPRTIEQFVPLAPKH